MLQSPEPETRIRWLTLVIMLLAVYVTVLFMHLQVFSSLTLLWKGQEDPLHWNNSAYQVDGEFILGTHDAFRWAAGGVGQGPAVGEAPSEFLAGLSRLSGVSVGTLAFWTPMFAAGLIGLAAALWAWSLGGVEASLAAGLVAALAPGFFYRSRLGYFDTDMATLLGPLVITLALAMWLGPRLHENLPEAWRGFRMWLNRRAGSQAPPEQQKQDPNRQWGEVGSASMLAMALTGVAARYLGTWHTHIVTFVIVTYVMALALILVMGRDSESRGHCLWGLACFGMAAFLGWIGLGLALAVVLFKAWPRGKLPGSVRSAWPALAAAVLVLVMAGSMGSLKDRVQGFTDAYSKPTVQSVQAEIEAAGEGPLYPGVDQSIIEAQNVDVGEMFFKMHAWVWVAVVGVVCFAGLVWWRARLVLLLPLLVLALMAWKYGTRTAMFGGPAVGLGLAVPYCLAYPPWRGNKDQDLKGAILAWSCLSVAGGALFLAVADLAWLVACCWAFGLIMSFAVTRRVDQGKPLISFNALSAAAMAALMVLGAILIVIDKRGESTVLPHALLATAMGACVPFLWLANKRLAGTLKGRALRMGFLVLVAAVLMIPYFRQYPRLGPTPVLAKYHVIALEEFRRRSPEDAMVWTWWDWGYATNYYAHRDSFADGANHAGEVILPLGLALSTSSPLQSRQIILFSAQHDYQPRQQWSNLSGESLANFLDTLAQREVGYQSSREQYLVVTLENIRLMPWIGYFGLWDVAAGEGQHPEVYRLRPEEMEVDMERGMMREIASGGTYEFQTLDVMDLNGRDHREYPDNANNMHLLVFKPTGDVWIVGPKAYGSMLVRLLICPDDDPGVTSQFELALDLYPLVRIWRVRQEPLLDPSGVPPQDIFPEELPPPMQEGLEQDS